MKQKDIITLVLIASITAVFAGVVSTLLFSPPKHDATAPSVPVISNSMPDIANDPDYNTIFNEKALDPSQPIEIGGNQNQTPFKSP